MRILSIICSKCTHRYGSRQCGRLESKLVDRWLEVGTHTRERATVFRSDFRAEAFSKKKHSNKHKQ